MRCRRTQNGIADSETGVQMESFGGEVERDKTLKAFE